MASDMPCQIQKLNIENKTNLRLIKLFIFKVFIISREK